AWMTSAGHSAMTGAESHVDPRVGGAYDAWDGYIRGRTLILEPRRRIVQSWRTADFEDGHADSQIEVLLAPADEGTRVTIRHTNVPAGQLGYEQGGWQESYFEPMGVYFARS
ncbi:MAG: SRPBCC domain-containing protein, partial [Gaiellales bacterium]